MSLMVGASVLASGCDSAAKQDKPAAEVKKAEAVKTEPVEAVQPEEPKLAAVLADRATASSAKRSPEAAAIMQAAEDQLAASDILERAINVGDVAPTFTLPNAAGEQVSLAKLLEKGPVAVLWYRGGWCPYCNLTLAGYAAAGKQITEAGGTLVAISPELPDNSLDTQQKNELEYQVLSDVGNAVAKQFEIVFELPPDLAKMYNEKFSLNTRNGDTSNSLPLAATYVIGQDGKVAWAFLDADYKKRAEPSEVVAQVRALAGAEHPPG
ncbi:putative peroxiredoxin bcp [Enhygromyxa salina]|uniref:thioredoxin-dependent peroxiredoxin n=2 Tax=Enhygromyxa salina TaxID=215803 RepID=A0A2S9YT29_9BACT|nr:putative peroxiredoxin bcp [Enhygromyxa salina]